MQNYLNQSYQCPCNVQQQAVTNPLNTQQNGTIQVPNYSGVNIQIFNPSVGTPGGAPTYNVNAPQYSSYPAGYYTGQWSTNNCGCSSVNNGVNNGNGVNGTNYNNDAGYNNASGYNSSNGYNNASGYNSSNGYNGAGGYNNSNGLDNNINNSINNTSNSNNKKEKRNIVMLTDEYIKNLENYLNSQDKEIRMMGAKEVVARIEEDESRHDDKALTALINKMLQDKDSQIRLLALSMLYSRKITGDEYTKGVLQKMQNSTAAYGQDALTASDILLKMSGQTVKKEFEVTNGDKK